MGVAATVRSLPLPPAEPPPPPATPGVSACGRARARVERLAGGGRTVGMKATAPPLPLPPAEPPPTCRPWRQRVWTRARAGGGVTGRGRTGGWRLRRGPCPCHRRSLPPPADPGVSARARVEGLAGGGRTVGMEATAPSLPLPPAELPPPAAPGVSTCGHVCARVEGRLGGRRCYQRWRLRRCPCPCRRRSTPPPAAPGVRSALADARACVTVG